MNGSPPYGTPPGPGQEGYDSHSYYTRAFREVRPSAPEATLNGSPLKKRGISLLGILTNAGLTLAGLTAWFLSTDIREGNNQARTGHASPVAQPAIPPPDQSSRAPSPKPAAAKQSSPAGFKLVAKQVGQLQDGEAGWTVPWDIHGTPQRAGIPATWGLPLSSTGPFGTFHVLISKQDGQLTATVYTMKPECRLEDTYPTDGDIKPGDLPVTFVPSDTHRCVGVSSS